MSLKKINPGLKIAHHSCGDVEQVIPDFIEIGLDVLNPIQPKAMCTSTLKKKYGSGITFWGGIEAVKKYGKYV